MNFRTFVTWLSRAALFGAAGAAAADAAGWTVTGQLLGKADIASNLSGIACMETSGFPRRCLVVDDESQSAQIVVLRDGELVAGDTIRLIADTFEGKPIEFDGEGVSYADGAFYVIGSHGHPRDKKHKLHAEKDKDKREIDARIAACSVVFRIPLTPADVDETGKLSRDVTPEPSRRLREALMGAHELTDFMDRRLDDEGLTIEGVAVRGDRLFAGLRAPLLGDDHEAVIAEVSVAALYGHGPIGADLHKIDLGDRRGVRDLAVLDDGFALLAGPSEDPDPATPVERGDYRLVRWDGASGVSPIVKLDGLKSANGKWVKPEAVLPLGDGRFLILSDGAEQGAPRVVVANRG